MTMLQSLSQWFDGVIGWQGPKATNPRLSKEEAVAITKAETERQGWPWKEPVHVGHVNARPFTQKEILWVMRTNDDGGGGWAHVHIWDDTGEVSSSFYVCGSPERKKVIGTAPSPARPEPEFDPYTR